jgi:hypothetical protein
MGIEDAHITPDMAGRKTKVNIIGEFGELLISNYIVIDRHKWRQMASRQIRSPELST